MGISTITDINLLETTQKEEKNKYYSLGKQADYYGRKISLIIPTMLITLGIGIGVSAGMSGFMAMGAAGITQAMIDLTMAVTLLISGLLMVLQGIFSHYQGSCSIESTECWRTSTQAQERISELKKERSDWMDNMVLKGIGGISFVCLAGLAIRSFFQS